MFFEDFLIEMEDVGAADDLFHAHGECFVEPDGEREVAEAAVGQLVDHDGPVGRVIDGGEGEVGIAVAAQEDATGHGAFAVRVEVGDIAVVVVDGCEHEDDVLAAAFVGADVCEAGEDPLEGILIGSAGVLDDAHGCLGEDEEVGGFVDVVVAAELRSDAVDPCAGGGFPCGVPFGFGDLLFDDIEDRGPVGIAEALAGVEVGGNVWKRGHG